MSERRGALKIIGAIGATCLFPFQADELYGQHAHSETGATDAPVPSKPRTLTAREFQIVSIVADLVIPKTDTASASEAGVPMYIDYVAGTNEKVLAVLRGGLDWLAKSKFDKKSPAQRTAVLRRLCDSAESKRRIGERERFWTTIKSLTADGYYTSRAGMRDELGYKGNAVLDRFPECQVPEH